MRHISRIDETTRLNTEPSGLASRRHPVNLRRVDIFTRVELECRFGAVHLQMQFRRWVVELRQTLERLRARVQRDLGWVGLYHEHVVDVRLGRA